VTITNEPEAMEGSSHDFSNVNPLLPPVMTTVWPYVLSGIQSEVPNDSPTYMILYQYLAAEKTASRELHLNGCAILRV